MMLSFIKILCEAVLQGELTPAQAVIKVGTQEAFFTQAENLGVQLTPRFVLGILKQYLLGKKSSAGIAEWAQFILFSNAFKTPTFDKGSQCRYESLWTTLRELSAPERYGKITPERAKAYIKTLEAL
jgi:hypothetical protein